MCRFLSVLLCLLAVLSVASCSDTVTVPEGKKPRSIDFEAIINNAKEKVFPALVFVKPILEEYERGEKKQIIVFGSGIIISPDGYMVTNNHVVEKATRIKCVLFDERLVGAKLIGRDKDTDLALLKLDQVTPEEKFPFAEFAEANSLKDGNFVLALGAPWGFTRSISLGIAGNVRRFISDGRCEYSLWIQTDASINPGNSGGPLIDTEGRIVGINTLGSNFGGDMAFSIPSKTVQRVVGHLKEYGEVKRSWTGMRIQPLKDLESETFLDRNTGVLVSSVDDNSPAKKAGMKVGDIILSVNGSLTNGVYDIDLPEIRWFLGDLQVEKPSVFVVERDGKPMDLSIVPRDKGKVEGEDYDCERWDFTVKEINEFDTPSLFYYKKQGVYVQGTQYPGNGRNAGLREGDIIVSIDKTPISSLAEMKKVYNAILEDNAREKKMVIDLLRSGTPRIVVLKYDMNYDKE